MKVRTNDGRMKRVSFNGPWWGAFLHNTEYELKREIGRREWKSTFQLHDFIHDYTWARLGRVLGVTLAPPELQPRLTREFLGQQIFSLFLDLSRGARFEYGSR